MCEKTEKKAWILVITRGNRGMFLATRMYSDTSGIVNAPRCMHKNDEETELKLEIYRAWGENKNGSWTADVTKLLCADFYSCNNAIGLKAISSGVHKYKAICSLWHVACVVVVTSRLAEVVCFCNKIATAMPHMHVKDASVAYTHTQAQP